MRNLHDAFERARARAWVTVLVAGGCCRGGARLAGLTRLCTEGMRRGDQWECLLGHHINVNPAVRLAGRDISGHMYMYPSVADDCRASWKQKLDGPED